VFILYKYRSLNIFTETPQAYVRVVWKLQALERTHAPFSAHEYYETATCPRSGDLDTRDILGDGPRKGVSPRHSRPWIPALGMEYRVD